jgi:hypothetical protein
MVPTSAHRFSPAPTMSAKTLEIIEAKRLAVAQQQKSFEASSDIGTFADLPPPSTPADVADIDKKFNEESKDFVSEGLTKLAAGRSNPSRFISLLDHVFLRYHVSRNHTNLVRFLLIT